MVARITLDDVIATRARPGLGRELMAGARAGQAGGLAFALAATVLIRVFLHKSVFYPLQVVGASALGEATVPQAFMPSLFVRGLLVSQLLPSLGWGLFFGALVWMFRPRGGVALAFLGLLVGATAQVVDVQLLLPHIPVWLEQLGYQPLAHDVWSQHIPTSVSWLSHLAYGFALSLYPWKFDPIARTFD